MPRRATPLPQGLDGTFSVAQAAAAGVTPGRLRGGDLVSPTSGIRMLSEPEGLLELARAFALALPEPWAYSHLTAARLHGLPVREPWTPDEPLHVVRPTPLAMIRRRGAEHHRGLERRPTLRRHGLPVVGVGDTWCDLAPALAVDERVILADAAVNIWTGAPLSELVDAVHRRSGRPGARAAREALPLVRTRSRSRMETVARLAFARAGLPEPELNGDIRDGAGGWLATSDFVWREQRTLAEYEGDHHRSDRRAWRYDHVRRRNLVDEGWRVHVLTAYDFADPAATRRCLTSISADLGMPFPRRSRPPDRRPRA